ncbi:type 2 lanthipeptide synthetase LanM family protein [Solwaraspora sp. WMMD1047]|uniref:type 2 lanthipeptide synthetase LanM family protein n=1 Tax=Solwaraspora sp. WMMD1047 TaxID=3016102 RepID=UPI002417E9E5|nr:type 2 lanthipeptide synthetase LanM family protein [Solwaraspora sp. WMMD1047]MDG4830833.1 type 2 lanthipeptide synthetase LanM family protein [Solwaraspora sp. WMMD1047]
MELEPTAAAAEPTRLATGWWARGTALHERIAGVGSDGPVVPPGGDHVRERLDRWRSVHPTGNGTEPLAGWLDGGIDEVTLAGLLAEAPDRLAARLPYPDWAELAECAVRRSVDLPMPPDVPASWDAAFALPVRPFVAVARERMLAGLPARLTPAEADLGALGLRFATQLSADLVRLAAPTLVGELNDWRRSGRLTGADAQHRFADFVRQVASPAGLAGLCQRYPVLARLLAQTCRRAVRAHLELLDRYATDRPQIVADLLGGVDPGPALGVETGRGDPHQGGRTVAFLLFAADRRVVYKPRSLAGQVRFHGLVRWLDRLEPGLDLPTVATVPRSGYGWMEFVLATPLTDADGAERFYRRQGALLALLHAVRATDIHHGNLLAHGDQPVITDAETIFQPDLTPPTPPGAVPDDPAAQALAGSVRRTGLLPDMVAAEHGVVDISGLGGDSRWAAPVSAASWADAGTDRMRLTYRPAPFAGGANRPRLDGRPVEPADFRAALVDGFRRGYDAIHRRRSEFTDLVEAAADDSVRVVVRPTQRYATLLTDARRPEVLRDGLDRDLLLARLWADAAGHPVRRRVTGHEIRDLWAGDVPYFSARAGQTELLASDGSPLPDLLPVTGIGAVRAGLAAMSGPDRLDQEWLLAATLASRRPATGTSGPARRQVRPAGSGADPSRLLAAACAIADQIVVRSMTNRDRINWLGLELVDGAQWLVLPMGAGFGSGYCGVALFLAQLAELTGVSRYGDAALGALRAVPPLLAGLARRPDLVAAIGCGGYHGLGGIAYALSRLAALLDDAGLRDQIEVAVELATVAATPPGPAGVAAGTAGCLAAMAAVHHESGSPAAARLAARCADRLADLADRTDGWCAPGPGPAPAGFADGTAGIGWALIRYAADGDPTGRHAQAGRSTLDRADLSGQFADVAGTGWSRGLAGVLAARTAGLGSDQDGRAVPRLGLLTGRPVLRDLSLDRGELGVTEALTLLSGQVPAAARAIRQRAPLIVDAVNNRAFDCGTPDGVPTPGLLTGLAGIGYGLLRLGFAHQVPSALLLQPGGKPR